MKPSYHVPRSEENRKSMLMAWMNLNKVNAVARRLTYVEIPEHFCWNRKKSMFEARKKGFQRGELDVVPRTVGELYFLRILLGLVRGPTCDEEIRCFDGVVYETYEEACRAHGVLEE